MPTESMFDIATYEKQGLPIRRMMRRTIMLYMEEMARRYIPLDRLWEVVTQVDPRKRFDYQLRIDEAIHKYWTE